MRIAAGKEAKLVLNHNISAEAIQVLAKLDPDGLHTVSLSGPNVGNTHLEYVQALSGLRSLQLLYTGVNDAGIALLKDMPDLRILDLNDVDMSDLGMESLARMPLSKLSIAHAKISNSSIQLLSQMRSLRYLSIQNTRISPEGLVTLQYNMESFCEVVAP